MKSILIVDDNKENLYLLRSLLQGYGYEVEEARNGAEALDKAHQNLPDLLISDLLMPVMDGYSLLRLWKKDEQLKQIPFVVYTATYTEPKDEKLALDLGANAFIIKPSEPDVFMSRIHQILSQENSGALSESPSPDGDEKVLLQQYNEVLIHRLEMKMAQLEQANRALERDVDARRRTETELRRVDRARRAISECNQILIHATEESELLSHICRVIVEHGGYRFAWVGFADSDETKPVRPVAQAGFDEGFLSAIPLNRNDSGPDLSPTGAAIRTGKSYLIQDIFKDSTFAAFRTEASKRGYGSVFVLPLMGKAQALGALSIFASLPDAFDFEEVRLLNELANDLAFGVVSLRQRAEQLRSEERIREQVALLDAATDAIYVSDLNHTVLYWNVAAERLYGWGSDSAIGCKINEILHFDAAAMASAQQVLRLKGSWSGELQQTNHAGKVLMVFCRWTMLRDAQNQPKKVLAINTDITEKKQLESNFLRAQRLEGIGAMASGIAHDLNNILSPMLMIAPLLRNEVKDADSLSMIDTVESCAQRGADIIKQLLTFARGKPGTRVTLPARHLLRDIDKIIRETFPREIHLQMQLPAELWLLLGDATQIHQALMNLCINARDAMPEGGILTLAANNVNVEEEFAASNPDARMGPYVCLSVSDTGTGIPPEIMDHIFDPFFTTKEVGKGTGLGLPTVLGIVRGHGGFVRVTSSPRGGSAFELYFPASPHVQETRATPPEESIPHGNGEGILIVDDEAPVRDSLRRTLECHGYRIFSASQGLEGLEIFASHRAEIRGVLTDMMMPAMNGAALVKALNNIDPLLPILCMTGLADRQGIKDLDKLNVSAILIKPFTNGDLLGALRAALQRKAG